jgi:hypothetical protein
VCRLTSDCTLALAAISACDEACAAVCLGGRKRCTSGFRFSLGWGAVAALLLLPMISSPITTRFPRTATAIRRSRQVDTSARRR